MGNDTTFRHFYAFDVALKLWMCFPPVLMVIGTIANVLSIIVLLRKPMRNSNTMFYLTVLSFADLFVLYTGLLRYWLKFGFDKDLRLISSFFCKFHGFLVYVSLDFTAWILVAVTIDRCVSIRHPFKAKSICTRKVAKVTVCVILVSLMLINFHLFWTLGILDLADEIQCTSVSYFGTFVWPWMDFSVFSFIPFIIMIVSNIIIVRQLCLSSRRLNSHRMRCNSSNTDNGGVQHKADTNSKCQEVPGMSIHHKLRKIPSVTVMLLSVNCLFFILTVPIVVYLIGYDQWYVNTSDEARAWMQLIWALCNILQYLNNTIHFFLYCLTGPRFRREFKALFLKSNRVAVVDQISATVELY